MKTTARAILATEQGQATIRAVIANVRESAGPKAHMESELAAQLIEAQAGIAELKKIRHGCSITNFGSEWHIDLPLKDGDTVFINGVPMKFGSGH